MIDRRGLVLCGAWAAGNACAHLPETTAGYVFGLCVAFLVGAFGRRLIDRWANDGGGHEPRGGE